MKKLEVILTVLVIVTVFTIIVFVDRMAHFGWDQLWSWFGSL